MLHNISQSVIDTVTHRLTAHQQPIRLLQRLLQGRVEGRVGGHGHVRRERRVHFRQKVLSLGDPLDAPARGVAPREHRLADAIHQAVARRPNEAVLRPDADLKAPRSFQPCRVLDAVLRQIQVAVLVLHFGDIGKDGGIQRIFRNLQVRSRLPNSSTDVRGRNDGERIRVATLAGIPPKGGMRNVKLLVRVERRHDAINCARILANQIRDALRVVVGRGNGQTATRMKVLLHVHEQQRCYSHDARLIVGMLLARQPYYIYTVQVLLLNLGLQPDDRVRKIFTSLRTRVPKIFE